jgi:PAS domain S-box-containing protein
MRNEFCTILLVEDNQDHVELAQRAFEPFCDIYQLFPVRSFSDARRKIDELNPDLVIADYRLPDGVGTDLLTIRGDQEILPLILLTSHGDEKLAVAALKAGILDYVVKSADSFADLPRIANRSIREWRTAQEHRLAEQRLRESQKRLQTILAHAPVSLWTITPEGVFIYWQGKQRLPGLPGPEEIIGRSVYDLFENRHAILANFRRALKGEILTAQEHSQGIVLETRYQPVMEGDGRLSQVIGVSTDITDREHALEELRRMHTAIEQSEDEIIITDPNGIIKYVNPAFERNMGFLRSEVIGNDIKSLDNLSCEGSLFAELWSTLTSGQVWKGRLSDSKKNGTIYHSDAIISPIRDPIGLIIGFAWIKRDVTARLALEKQLIQAQKMQAIGTLANGIAHDFNNILAAIVGYAEMALYQAPDHSAQKYNLQRVLQAGERARQLVRQILAFSRQTPGETLCVPVRLIAQEVLQLLRAAIPSTIEIKADLLSDVCVQADPSHIHQILMNLCSNAAQSMHDSGGNLEITLRHLPCDEDMTRRFSHGAPGGFVRVTVKDTGGGIPAEHLDRIFDPFFTTKSPGKGTGLGLSVVSNIVNIYGGFIDVENHPGKGVTFQVYLPASMAEASQAPAVQSPQSGSGEHILFIDDESLLTEIGEQILLRLGYRVTVANDSLAALEIFKASPHAYDLVISDLTMPNLTGDRLVREMMVLRPDLPVIICTGMAESVEEEKVKALGVRALAVKPITINQLAEIIRQALS